MPGASAAHAGRPTRGGARSAQVEKLLADDLLDTSGLAYDFGGHHVALIAVGGCAEHAVETRAASAGAQSLVVTPERGVAWGWLGSRNGFERVELDSLDSGTGSDGACIAIGEPGAGLSGWRLSHHQARAALAVAIRGSERVARYADVALIASVVKDDLLAASLRGLYLEPLEGERDGGETLRRTLRAYFAADRNVSRAAAAIGVTRQAVARRLRAAEQRLGRSIAASGLELETALRLEALEARSRSGP